MHILAIIRIIGILIIGFSFSMLVPAFVALIYGDGGGKSFIQSFVIILMIGVSLWGTCHRHKQVLHTKEGFLIVVSFWLALGLLAVIPFMLLEEMNISFADAVFESFSALTTTGATVITGLDNLPKSILFYRQFLQFLGGMGLIVLSVAVIPLPILGTARGQLFRLESSGPLKDQKNLPRINEVAKLLWLYYCGITIICTLAYWLAGMSFFDALTHSFSTVSNGGMSTHDASLGYFQNPSIYFVCAFFMFIAGCNFALHLKAILYWKHQPIWKTYLEDPEFRFFCIIQIIFIILMCVGLYLSYNISVLDAFSQGTVQLLSMSTTAGFTLFDFDKLPSYLSTLLVFSAILGGCGGSTAGGLKMIRVLVIWLQFKRELKYLVHPNLIIPIKLGNQLLPERVLGGIWTFIVAFFLTYWICVFAVTLSGISAFDAMGAVFATITNAGPGIGKISLQFATAPDFAKYVFSFAMTAGRLEMFSLLILFSLVFWKS